MDEENVVRVQLPGGTITALRENGLIHARGIPYGEAGRFERPTLREQWDEVLDGTKPAPICPQRPSRLNFVMGDINEGRQMSEQCLHLSITAPAHALNSESKLPVMVWFHGGAFLSGGGDLRCYEPHSLAHRGLVVVNVSYRLGIFGYLGVDDTTPANRGLLDQMTALRWVQKQISALGGDPHQVTIVGQSAGGESVFCLLVADDTGGLFQRAILQSPPLGVKPMPEASIHRLLHLAKDLFGDRVLTASSDEVLDIQTKILVEGSRLNSIPHPLETAIWPQFGQYPLPDWSEIPQRIQLVASQGCDIMVGWTQDDGAAFVPSITSQYRWLKLPVFGSLVQSCLTWLITKRGFMWPSQKLHQQFLEAGGCSSTYVFRWCPPGNPLGAIHCIELPFLFGSWDSWKAAPMLQGEGSQEVFERLGQEVKNLWVDFITSKKLQSRNYVIDKNWSFQPL